MSRQKYKRVNVMNAKANVNTEPPPPKKKIKLKDNDFDCCPRNKTFVQLKLTNIVLDAKILSQKLVDKAKNKTISENNREKKKKNQ